MKSLFRQIEEKKRNFENVSDLIEALLEHPELPEEQTERMDVDHIEGPPLVLANDNPTSLKRKRDGSKSSMFNGHSSCGSEAPTKKSKTGKIWSSTSTILKYYFFLA